MRSRHLLPIAALTLAAAAGLPGCRTGPEARGPDAGSAGSAPCAGSAPDHVVAVVRADRALKRRLTRALEELADGGDAPALGDLEQPDGERCPVRILGDADDLPPLDAPAVAGRLRKAVVAVGRRYLCGKCDNWHTSTASGFVVGPDLVVTCDHVLGEREDSTFAVMTSDDEVLPVVGLVGRSEASDVAVLRVRLEAGVELTPLPLAPGLGAGHPVHVMSHPRGAFWTFTSGVLSRRVPGDDGAAETVEITAPFAKGSSGAPVVDARGAVVGIVRSTDSVYYTESRDEQRDLQMVFRQCTGVEAVVDLLQ